MIQSIEASRKEAGDRAIADKIIKRLHDLEKTVENNQGRWAWELLQNAKDSIAEDDNRTVSVQIRLDEDSVEFRHNGTHFTEQDVIGLISQISSKIEKIQEVKELTNLLEEFKADDISALKSMLRLAQNVLADDSNKIEITPEILLSLGVTSIDELEAALRDKGIAAKFTHTSTPTVEMFITVQKLIARAKTNVIKYLESLEEYDCTDLEELATTVIGGIKKDGLPIYIVVRPSDNGEVIIYYSIDSAATAKYKLAQINAE